MSFISNVVKCYTHFPEDVKYLATQVKEKGWKKTWNEDSNRIIGVAITIFAGLSAAAAVVLLGALPFQIVASVGAGVALATIIACVALRALSVSMIVAGSLYMAKLIGETHRT